MIMKISKLQLDAIADVSEQIFYGKTTHKAGIELLENQHKVNPSSAAMLVNNYSCMMTGKVFKRTMGNQSVIALLDKIFMDIGEFKKSNAISSLKEHVIYYEKYTGSNRRTLREIISNYETRIKQPTNENYSIVEFENRVSEALKDTQTNRLNRMAIASKKPKAIEVLTKFYVRNPDVVAQTLFRAKGKCESCGKDAPFKRAKNGEPFLEVHHKIQLANDGDDSIENAIALCPNCHRKFHYGIPDSGN